MSLVKIFTVFFFFIGLSFTAQAQVINKIIETENTSETRIKTEAIKAISATNKTDINTQKENINEEDALTFHFRYKQFLDLNNRKIALC